MNAAADRLDDSYPHGTVDGYKGGCKGNVCPAGADHGLSCKKANQLHAGDYRYQKLVKRGMTPGEIADELGLNPDPSAAPAKPKPSPADVARHTTVREEPPAPPAPLLEAAAPPLAEWSNDPSGPEPTLEVDEDAAVQVPGEDVAEGEGMGHYTFARFTAGLSQKAAREKGAEIREWMRTHGWPNVRGRGTVPQEALAAYAAVHPLLGGTEAELAPVGEQELDDAAAELVTEGEIEDGLTEHDEATDVAMGLPEWSEVVSNYPPAEHFASEILDETRDRIQEQPRPEWGTVAESVDVERAREIAARLFLELTDAEAARDRAESALELTLQKWSDAVSRGTRLELHLRILRPHVQYLRDVSRLSEKQALTLSDELARQKEISAALRLQLQVVQDTAEEHRTGRRAAELERDRLRALIEAEAIATPRRRRALRKAAS